MSKLHVLLKKEELDAQRLPDKVVVVLDVLFATTSIVTALAHGASEVVPTLDREAAFDEGGAPRRLIVRCVDEHGTRRRHAEARVEQEFGDFSRLGDERPDLVAEKAVTAKDVAVQTVLLLHDPRIFRRFAGEPPE